MVPNRITPFAIFEQLPWPHCPPHIAIGTGRAIGWIRLRLGECVISLDHNESIDTLFYHRDEFRKHFRR